DGIRDLTVTGVQTCALPIWSRRVLAPIAFMPVTMLVKTGSKQAVDLARRGEGMDLIIPNIALLAWLEQQTGRPLPDLSEALDGRSEERRVGRECGGEWGRGQ